MHIKIASVEDISIIQKIAFETWPDAYKDILSTQQLNYMLDLMYNKEELSRQFEDKNNTYIISLTNNTPTGFSSYSLISEQNSYKLHKLYILPDYQSKGIGKYMLDFILSDLKTKNAKRLMLNVNRNNKAVKFYLNQHFKITKEEDNDIGNGFYMNDYVMEKLVG
jgi:ribosomal protein S18 acetylase RimI-like enzyme